MPHLKFLIRFLKAMPDSQKLNISLGLIFNSSKPKKHFPFFFCQNKKHAVKYGHSGDETEN